jgi:hypothetical protein
MQITTEKLNEFIKDESDAILKYQVFLNSMEKTVENENLRLKLARFIKQESTHKHYWESLLKNSIKIRSRKSKDD